MVLAEQFGFKFKIGDLVSVRGLDQNNTMRAFVRDGAPISHFYVEGLAVDECIGSGPQRHLRLLPIRFDGNYGPGCIGPEGMFELYVVPAQKTQQDQ